MSTPIEDYGFIGDTETGALVSRQGSIDWLCLPRFDSGACLAALLGDQSHGRWLLGPASGASSVRRRYRDETLILETEFEDESGSVRVVDLMPPRARQPDLVRVVEGLRGRVPMRTHLTLRFDYGATVPWVRPIEGGLLAVAGPDAIRLQAPVELLHEDSEVTGEFTVAEGQRVPLVLSWHPSYESAPAPIDGLAALEQTEKWWQAWAEPCTYDGQWPDLVMRSLLTLKALTFAPSGGIVAAATTSLPEHLGGVRNWDYRYCWLRDATFTLYALLLGGFEQEAVAWRDWLLRAVAGEPVEMQILYGPTGERRLPEMELPWLPGYEGSRPVRIGNAAARQFQLDVYGELMDCMHQARRTRVEPDPESWRLQRALMDFLESNWRHPDEGIWEVRGPRRHFTHSKVMAWVAADRAVKAVKNFGLDGPVGDWRRLRQEIHDEVCREGWDAERRTFTQFYGSKALDASLLMIPLVGFLPPGDERVAGTVEAIQRELCQDGLVLRYQTEKDGRVDGLPHGEGAFLACSFWLADNLTLMGRTAEARALFERLCSLCNDLGLLSEEFDAASGRLVGNFPQAFSHVSLVNSARNLSQAGGPAEDRQRS